MLAFRGSAARPTVQAKGCRTRTAVHVVAFQDEERVLQDQRLAVLSPPFRNTNAARSGKGVTGQPARWSNGYAAVTKGKPLQLWGHELPSELLPSEVDIEVTHNGLCHSDMHMQNDDWGVSKFPFIPGHEVVGVVKAFGSQVKGLQLGQRVGAGWIRDSCRRCPACLRGEENICDLGYTGMIVAGNHGGFQAVLRMPAEFAYTIPDGLSSEAAAPLLCAGITVFAPLKRHMTRPGMSVAVLGIGGLGHLALQFAAAMGGSVTAIDISPDKEQEAKKLGANSFIAFNDQAAMQGARGAFDLLINCASARVSAADLLALLRKDGTLVQVGIPGGNAQMQLPLQDVVFNQKRVAGSIVGGRSDMDAMLRLAAARGISPMIELMPMNKVNEAIERVASGKARYRVVLVMDSDPKLTTDPPNAAAAQQAQKQGV